MSYFKCSKCESVLFEQINPQVFGANGVRVWNAGDPIPSEHTSVTLLKCIKCGTIIIPSCSLVGKNALDKDVQIYRELIGVVEAYNKDNSQCSHECRAEEVLDSFDKQILQLFLEHNDIIKEQEILKEKLKEIVGTKVGKRSKKSLEDNENG